MRAAPYIIEVEPLDLFEWEYRIELALVGGLLAYYAAPVALIADVLASEEAVHEAYAQWERDWQECQEMAFTLEPEASPERIDALAHDFFTAGRWEAPILEWRPL